MHTVGDSISWSIKWFYQTWFIYHYDSRQSYFCFFCIDKKEDCILYLSSWVPTTLKFYVSSFIKNCRLCGRNQLLSWQAFCQLLPIPNKIIIWINQLLHRYSTLNWGQCTFLRLLTERIKVLPCWRPSVAWSPPCRFARSNWCDLALYSAPQAWWSWCGGYPATDFLFSLLLLSILPSV